MSLLQHSGKVQQIAKVHFLQPALVAKGLSRRSLNHFRRKRLAQLQGVPRSRSP